MSNSKQNTRRSRKSNLAVVESPVAEPTPREQLGDFLQPTTTAVAVASEVVVEGLDDLLKRKQELEAAVKAKKVQAETREWETGALAKNPQYVVGSLRKATDADKTLLGAHCHGEVAEITCAKCGTVRLVNKQDAKQVKFCTSCVASARKEAAKAKRKAKANDPAKIQAKIDALQAQLKS